MSIGAIGFPGVVSAIAAAVQTVIAAGYTAGAGLVLGGPNYNENFRDIASNGAYLMGITNTGKLMRSYDGGQNWSFHMTVPGFTTGLGLVYGGGYWLAVGTAPADVAYSTDGENWTKFTTLSTLWGASQNILSVCYNPILNKFLFTGYYGCTAIYTPGGTVTGGNGLGSSTDWGTSASVLSCAVNPQTGVFVVGGGGGRIAYSADGVTWSYNASVTTYIAVDVTNLAFGEDAMWLLATTTANRIYRCSVTPTYTSWSSVNTSQPGTSLLQYNDGSTTKWYYGTSNGALCCSSDQGSTWVQYNALYGDLYWDSLSILNLRTIALSGSPYLWICGQTMRLAKMRNHIDVDTPTVLETSKSCWGNNSNGVKMCNNATMAFAINGSGVLASSTDGINWIPRYAVTHRATWNPLLTIGAIVASDTRVVIFGGTRIIVLDIATWTVVVEKSVGVTLRCGVWTGTRFVAGANEGTLWYSSDGVTWGQANQPAGWSMNTSNAVISVAWSGTKCMAVGYGGRCAMSNDGVTWGAHINNFSSNWGGAGYEYVLQWTGSRWFVGGQNVGTMTSVDGNTWVANSALYNAGFNVTIQTGVMYNGVLWVGGANKLLYYSTTGGLSWTRELRLGATWGTGTIAALAAVGAGICFTGANTTTNDGIGFLKP